MNRTLRYYEDHAKAYASDTQTVSLTDIQDLFLSYLPDDALILDFGCGAGRDTHYFISKGYQVDAVDGSDSLCQIASAYTGIQVKKMYFQELDAISKYDGIWACSSILHLPIEELGNVLIKISDALKPGGIVYTSFKYGNTDGWMGERYYTNMTEERLNLLLKEAPELTIIKLWVTKDVRPDRGEEKWMNALFKKKK